MAKNAATAEVQATIIRIRGRNTSVPSTDIVGRKVIVTGSFRKQVFDEELVEGEAGPNPPAFIAGLRATGLNADIFTFAQRPPDVTPKFDERFEWDNWAVVPTLSYNEWWEKLPQESRKNVRRSAKKGVTVRAIPFDATTIKGIQGIYDETPVRQGKHFLALRQRLCDSKNGE